jgi:hypothetical protein
VLDDNTTALTHHLPTGFEAYCFFNFASALGCKLVVEQSSSRTTKLFFVEMGSQISKLNVLMVSWLAALPLLLCILCCCGA